MSGLEAEIDAMVLDVIIPPRGARDVLENVLARRPDISLVLASGDDPPDDLRKTLEGCGGRFVRKPFRPGNLVATVAELVAALAPSPKSQRKPSAFSDRLVKRTSRGT